MVALGQTPDVRGHPSASVQYRWYERPLWGKHVSRLVQSQSSKAVWHLARQKRPTESGGDRPETPALHVGLGTAQARRESSSSARTFPQREGILAELRSQSPPPSPLPQSSPPSPT